MPKSLGKKDDNFYIKEGTESNEYAKKGETK